MCHRTSTRHFRALWAALLLWPALLSAATPAQDDADWQAWERELTEEALAFDDAPLADEVTTPSWFRLSFLNLREDLEEAARYGKQGLIVYFGQKFCPYCKKLMQDLKKRDIRTYTQRHFDVIAIDIHGDRTVTDLGGNGLTEKAFAEREKTNFTPSLIFYDVTGREALRLRGYHPPYQLRAALEYVADGHHRNEPFPDYLERADPALSFEPGGLNYQDFFAAPPFNLDRSRFPGERPLIVFFEQGDCHACDVLHSHPLQQPQILDLVKRFDTVQLGIWDDTPVVTPGGERHTARSWARALGLFYTPTLIFYDRDGSEIIRVDSVAHFYRLRRVLQYALSGAHREGITLQRWQREANAPAR